MTNASLPADLAELGRRIDRDGFADHEPIIAEIVAAGRAFQPGMGALDVLGDPTAPPAARGRALTAVGHHWVEICQHRLEQDRLARRRGQVIDEALLGAIDELLDVWNQHEDLRRTEPAVGELARSRERLDGARWAVARRRAELLGRRPARSAP